jgi:hypothetical protein
MLVLHPWTPGMKFLAPPMQMFAIYNAEYCHVGLAAIFGCTNSDFKHKLFYICAQRLRSLFLTFQTLNQQGDLSTLVVYTRCETFLAHGLIISQLQNDWTG